MAPIDAPLQLKKAPWLQSTRGSQQLLLAFELEGEQLGLVRRGNAHSRARQEEGRDGEMVSYPAAHLETVFMP
jgi:hypothetical protein